MLVLLVEDEIPKQQHIVGAMAEICPHAVIRTARSVRSAIREMQEAKPELMLLDMSLPTYDVGPTEPGGRPQNFGGVEVLRYMELYDLEVPTVVITAYEAFSKAGLPIDHKSLDDEMREDHPKIYRGLIYYNSLFIEWRTQLEAIIKSLGRLAS